MHFYISLSSLIEVLEKSCVCDHQSVRLCDSRAFSYGILLYYIMCLWVVVCSLPLMGPVSKYIYLSISSTTLHSYDFPQKAK